VFDCSHRLLLARADLHTILAQYSPIFMIFTRMINLNSLFYVALLLLQPLQMSCSLILALCSNWRHHRNCFVNSYLHESYHTSTLVPKPNIMPGIPVVCNSYKLLPKSKKLMQAVNRSLSIWLTPLLIYCRRSLKAAEKVVWVSDL
jgi:hypothetical protein